MFYIGEIGLPPMESNPGALAKVPAEVKGFLIFAVLFRRVLHLAYDFAPWVVGLQGEGRGGMSVRGEALWLFMLVTTPANQGGCGWCA